MFGKHEIETPFLSLNFNVNDTHQTPILTLQMTLKEPLRTLNYLGIQSIKLIYIENVATKKQIVW